MTDTPPLKIRINEHYSLAPLLEVEKDDITPIFKHGRGLYICNFPHEAWYAYHNFNQTSNYSIEKKEKFFELMKKGSILVSPTQDSKIKRPTRTIKIDKVLHLGSRFTGRWGQISMAIKLIKWLIIHRKSYDYCLCYNFDPVELIAAFVAKYVLGKRIVIDFEDDYLLQSKNKYYKLYFGFAKKIPDTVICINRNLMKYFPNQEVYVFNGFIELSYTKSLNFNLKENIKLLYSGALDEIRGVDLIPDIVKTLRKKHKKFTILITGSGPLEEEVRQWDFEEVKYLGFLSNEEYNKVLQEAEVYLVLQRPDHPFSMGSYPSKIEFYSHYKKPIFKIDLN
jgi:glycosyltransferase involved in cell wall biosynthesis